MCAISGQPFHVMRFVLYSDIYSSPSSPLLHAQVHLTEAACALSSILDKSVHGNTNACHTAETVLSPYRKELQNTEDTMARNDRLWDGLRERLRGELLGALPPPGAPLGALSIAPNGPVSHFGYVYAALCQPLCALL